MKFMYNDKEIMSVCVRVCVQQRKERERETKCETFGNRLFYILDRILIDYIKNMIINMNAHM